MLIPEELVRKYVRLDSGSEDGDTLADIQESAEAFVVGATQRGADELLEEGGGTLPPMLRQAVYMLVDDWYNKRSATTLQQAHEVPFGVWTLIKQYRKLTH